MKLNFIGDVHGDMPTYKLLTCGLDWSVQVGDFGIGFNYRDHDDVIRPVVHPDSVDPVKHRFIRGNHDNPELCKTSRGYISDGHVEMVDGVKIMYIGGASSIDKAMRLEGRDWWADEQLSTEEFDRICDVYSVVKPDVVVSHDCPNFLVNELAKHSPFGNVAEYSRTRTTFDHMLYDHAPKLWVFGHWHQFLDYCDVGGTNTRFVCCHINTIEVFDTEELK